VTPRESRFPLRLTPENVSFCLGALDLYRHDHEGHTEALSQIRKRICNAREKLLLVNALDALCKLNYPETSLLADALAHLVQINDEVSGPESLKPEIRRDAEMLLAALGDYNVTQFRAHEDRRRRQFASRPRPPNAADLAERRDRERRAAILREMVGTPQRIDVWGNVVDDPDGVPPGRITEVHGREDMRKHAKTTNFHCHPLQSTRAEPDDPETIEKVKESLAGGAALQYEASTRVKLQRR